MTGNSLPGPIRLNPSLIVRTFLDAASCVPVFDVPNQRQCPALCRARHAWLFRTTSLPRAIPPSFNAHIEKTVPTPGLILATVVVQNTGGTPVPQLRMLADFGDEGDARVVTIEYLPSHSKRRVGSVLNKEPDKTLATFEFVSNSEPRFAAATHRWRYRGKANRFEKGDSPCRSSVIRNGGGRNRSAKRRTRLELY